MVRTTVICAMLLMLSATITGCVNKKDFNMAGLMNMKRLGENQRAIEREIDKQERDFYHLLEDVKTGLITPGMTKRQLINEYGNPLFLKPLSGREHVHELLVYRHPTKYFDTTLIYLYFNKDGVLQVVEKRTGE